MPLKTLGPIGPRAVGERVKSKAKIFQFNINLYLIQRDDYSAPTWTNLRPIRNTQEKSKFKLRSFLTVYAGVDYIL